MGTEEKGRKRKKMNCCSGIHMNQVESFDGVLDYLEADNIFYLVENGQLLSPDNLPATFINQKQNTSEKRPLVVLGDDIGIDGTRSNLQELENIFEERGVTRFSLGKTSLLASHCIILFHYLLDSSKM